MPSLFTKKVLLRTWYVGQEALLVCEQGEGGTMKHRSRNEEGRKSFFGLTNRWMLIGGACLAAVILAASVLLIWHATSATPSTTRHGANVVTTSILCGKTTVVPIQTLPLNTQEFVLPAGQDLVIVYQYYSEGTGRYM